MKCLFCDIDPTRVIEDYKTLYAIQDEYPVTKDHMLIIPKRHIQDYFKMSSEEENDLNELLRILRRKILEDDSSVNGFNIGMNCGVSAGQTIMHAHVHLIPRRDGDTEEPRGGVRGVIPGMMSY
ncbi:MAG TPA: HIT family protein [Nitrospinota bacterium]|jgi:diadenosine tetraphosphate (Ap4A) HIT family hydrolase|nr:HIT family protein [Nitrospinota bacterium]|tara:strand:+ start:1891 stop:2262 length:372 start_codon:yes stop_codon:yes gene_type:complete